MSNSTTNSNNVKIIVAKSRSHSAKNRDLTLSQKAIFAVIVESTDWKTGIADISASRAGWYAGLKTSAAQKAIAALIKAGYLERLTNRRAITQKFKILLPTTKNKTYTEYVNEKRMDNGRQERVETDAGICEGEREYYEEDVLHQDQERMEVGDEYHTWCDEGWEVNEADCDMVHVGKAIDEAASEGPETPCNRTGSSLRTSVERGLRDRELVRLESTGKLASTEDGGSDVPGISRGTEGPGQLGKREAGEFIVTKGLKELQGKTLKEIPRHNLEWYAEKCSDAAHKQAATELLSELGSQPDQELLKFYSQRLVNYYSKRIGTTEQKRNIMYSEMQRELCGPYTTQDEAGLEQFKRLKTHFDKQPSSIWEE